ncbi:hypothetical protein [Niallia sp. NCCP-28]|uniref:hypothetical protein n=1 Tax=Niallia sp. NCCP-28 TaxID=2934712 RepID=UPI00207E36F2|nr:hypothetical protein [Niallia sp. NCCP-28]GKU84321.1 hypothetical protein NCCP28_37170 [Niallia sp. NCCP-28]
MFGSSLTILIIGIICLVLGFYLRRKWLIGISFVPFLVVFIGIVSLIIEKMT